MNSNKYLHVDEWLSSIISKPAYVLNINKDDDLDEVTNCFNNFIVKDLFISSKILTDRIDQVHTLTQKGFFLVDTNVLLEKKKEVLCIDQNECTISFASKNDEMPITDLAAKAFTYSRFHLDMNFTKDLANQVKREWTKNFFLKKRGDHMIVAKNGEKIMGFLLILTPPNGKMIIDLIAVDISFRGRAVARSMINFAEREIKGSDHLRVGTQIANITALRLYTKMGFSIVETKYILHYHGPRENL